MLLFFVLPALATAVALVCYGQTAQAVQTVPYKMNFQGRLTDTTGTPKADGTYNIRFRIYNAANTAVWTEDHLVSASAGVALVNGLFTVQLGSVTPLDPALFNTATANQNGMTLEVELPTPATATNTSPSWTEGAMTPRSPIATSAYAFNSDTLDGLDSSVLARKDTTNTFSTSNTFNGTSLFSVNDPSAVGIQNTSGTKAFTADTSNMVVQVGSSTADASSVVFVLDTKNTAGDPTGAQQVAGSMYYNSNSGKFRCYQGVAWTDCITTPSGGTTLQDTYNASSSPATITTTAGKGVNIMAGAVPTADLFVVDNTANPTVTPGVNAINVKYAGGAVGGEGSGLRVDYTPGSTSGGTWSGVRVVANATGPASGVTAYGIKLEGPTSQGAGTEEGMYIGTGWDIGVDIQSGGIQLAAQNDPAAPAAGNLRIYAKDIAGRVMPKWIGPAGVDTPMQASLGFNRVSMVMPAGGATLTTFVGGFGTTFTNTGTAANPTPAATNLLTSVRRATFSTGTTAGAVASHRQSVLQVWRGNAANRGGFFYTIRFGTSTLQAGNRAFVGLADSVTAPTNVDPTTNPTPGKIGVAINANTGNWKFVNNITGTAPTAVDLGATMPVNTTDLYELALYSPPNGSSIGYRLKNLTTNAIVSASVSTNIPSSTTFLAPQFWITNNATGAAAILDFSGWYLESDQ